MASFNAKQILRLKICFCHKEGHKSTIVLSYFPRIFQERQNLIKLLLKFIAEGRIQNAACTWFC